jgi:O-antigen/teichoic acid export membrane protein
MNIAAGSLVALVYRVLGIAALFAMSVVLARVMTGEAFGRYNLVIVAVGAAGSVAASFATSSGYFVSNRGRDAAEMASNTMVLSLGLGLLFAIAGGVALLFYDGRYETEVLLVSVAMFPIIARAALGGVHLGGSALWKYSFSVHGFGITGLALALVWMVALDRTSTADALGVWVASQYLAVLVLVVADWGWWSWLRGHRPDGPLIGQVVRFGAFTGLAGFVSYFNYRVDLLLVGWFDGDEAAGYYAAAVRFAEGLWLFSTTIAIASYAAVGSLSRSEAAAVTAEGVRHTLLVVTALAVPIAVLAPWLLAIFGAEFRDAQWALRILCVGTLLYAPQSVISNYYTVQLGKPWISLALATCSLCISVVVAAVLIPRIGYVGGAWATAISYAITAAISTWLFLRLSGVRPGDLWRIRREDVASYVRLAKRVLRGKWVEPTAPEPAA